MNVARERSVLVATLLVFVFLFFFPVLWMIITSFKTEGQAASFPPQFFFTPTLDRYAEVFERGMALYLLNSLFLAVGSTVVVMLLAIPAAAGLLLLYDEVLVPRQRRV